MTRAERNGIFIKWGGLFLIMTTIAGILTTYFVDRRIIITESIEYVDKRSDQNAERISRLETASEGLINDLNNTRIDIAVVKQILLERYGLPKILSKNRH